MEFRVLGPLEVIGPRGPIRIAGRRQRAILEILAVHLGESVSIERLIDEVWGDDPPGGAQHAVETHVARLRRALGPDRIETQPNGYRLRAEGADVDLERFEVLVADASHALDRGDPAEAAAGFAAALALWRGQPLGDLAARSERARLDGLHALALERWIDAELACGHHLELVPELRRLVGEMPLHEALQARLMLALYRSGRQADALEVYLQARAVLDSELGVEPGEELEGLQQAILAHHPGLAAAVRAGSRWLPAKPGDASLAVAESPPIPSDQATASVKHIPTRGGTRRIVTTLVATISASTRTGERIDPESERPVLECCFAEMRTIVERHGGIVETVVGDAVMAVFGVPIAHEDDALRAVRVASEMRDVLAARNAGLECDLGTRITMRAGINTGEVVTSRDVSSAIEVGGEAVNFAMRLEVAAGLGEILLDSGTYSLVRSAVDAEPSGPIHPNGRSGPIGAFRLLAVTPGVHGHVRRFDTPLIGRDRELRQLETALDQVTVNKTCQLFSVLGPAGVGKSRLVHEFLRSVRPAAQVLRGRCLPYGERAGLWPVTETIRQAAEIGEMDEGEVVRAKIAALVPGNPRASAIAQRVAALIGVSEPPSTSEETSWAVRSIFEAIAGRLPLVLVFDDVQWGEPAFLDLIEAVADSSREAPILLLCIARPELLDTRTGWGGGTFNATSVLLEPLTEIEVSQLLANLLGGLRPASAVERKIVAAAEGNPLFVEEFLAMLLDEGVIRRAGDEWVATADLGTITTPGSIMALLAARLDQLPADERDVLEPAAVIGKMFSREAVEGLVTPHSVPDVSRRLESLVRREIIRPDRSGPGGAEAYRFRHILIRDAAYAALPKTERIILHERLADWLARTSEGGLHPADDVIGAHYEQAYRYRTELGPLDDRARAVGRRAAGLLGDFGRRALLRGQPGVAQDLFSRAAALLPSSDRERLLVLADLTVASREHGQVAAAHQINLELMARAEAAGMDDLLWVATVEAVNLDWNLTGNVSTRGPEDLRAAIAYFERAGDLRAAARTWSLVGSLELFGGQLVVARVAQERALERARLVGDLACEANAMVEMYTIDREGPAPVAVGIPNVEGAIVWARAAGLLGHEALFLSQLSRLRAMVGEFDEARRLLESVVAIQSELGPSAVQVAVVSRWVGIVEWLAGDLAAAEQAFRRGFENSQRVDERQLQNANATYLAHMLYLQGRLDEAYEYTELAKLSEPSFTAVGRSDWRGVRGMILARRGDTSNGVAMAREAVAIAESTDAVLFHARALEDLAEVFELAGRPDDARPLLAQAIGLHEQKGATVLAERARLRETSSRR